ncbi:MAG TPA: 5-(carboxyamino)imidazole ribonucleotide synthase [Roseiflexaceae bacterium]|jgi:5-(carboxyamino)imidazole ribonucleotide synthase|nr:5-(carboxyamino)imidazole ribonucleotide synthase [Roseiflexaceae bacterium]
MHIGILGGGQLGRMLALAGYPLGARFRCLDPAPNGPMSHTAEQIVGNYDDADALRRFAEGLDVVTYEFENVPVETARRLARHVPVYPPPEALEAAQDRLVEKQFFQGLGIPTPPFMPVGSRADLEAAVAEIGLPAVLKTRRMGYDGKGQAVLRAEADVEAAWQALGGAPLILEGFVPFVREVSVLAVRGRDGATAFYPLVENHHRTGILRLSLAPAPNLLPELQAHAEDYATRVLEALNYVGVLAIEFFEVGDGRRTTNDEQSSSSDSSSFATHHSPRLLANEMAPRVHNSGHWTIEGAETSQFANHVRAVAGLPLGSTALLGYAAMVNLIGTVPDAAGVLRVPGAHLHLYGKAPRPGRKLGHVTLRADDQHILMERVAAVEALLNEH